jgi:hypothetical protein
LGFLRSTGGVVVGLLLSIPVHAIGIVGGMLLFLLGGAPTDAPWPQKIQNAFTVFLGFWQWVYLLPLIRWVRPRWPSVARGLGISGILVALMSMLGFLASCAA